MKSVILFIQSVLLTCIFVSCSSDSFISDIYIEPDASFTINKTEYDVHESVFFTKTGQGQKFVVYPGDSLHRYNQPFNTGYSTASNGTFSYAYNEPGVYTAVWVASSINENGEIIKAIDSTQITVVAKDGGLEKFVIFNTYKMTEYSGSVFFSSYGEFISEDTILCPILFDAWRTSTTVNSIKAPQLINFTLSSTLSKFYWIENGIEREIQSGLTSSRIVKFLVDGKLAVQDFVVKTASGITSEYHVAPVIIPKMTKFSVNGVNGTITRDIAYYNKFNVAMTLPAGTDLSNIIPSFEIMNNDVNLVGNNIEVSVNGVLQTSGVTSINASGKTVQYKIKSFLLGSDNNKLVQESIVTVNFQ